MTAKPRYGTIQEAADLLSVTRQTIWAWNKTIPDFPRGMQLSQRCTRWDLDAIEAWAKSRACKQPVAA